MRIKQVIAAIGLLLGMGNALFAQLPSPGEPYSWEQKDITRFDVPFFTMPAIDLELLRIQDAITDQDKSIPYRFGVEHEVSLHRENAGTSSLLEDGTMLWQLGLECDDAMAIGLVFSKFHLQKGAEVYIWNEDRTEFLGAFTHVNNKEWNSLGTALLYSDRVVVELIESPAVAGTSELEVGMVVHAYRSILQRAEEAYNEANRGPFGNSDPCNININCPQGDEWQVEKKAVALIVDGGFAVCTGALVNNTSQDGTPYFLTANHCLGGQNNWVFYFNHESSTCNGSSGPVNQNVSGSQLLANNANSDFALLLLSETPPASFDVQYAGWDNSDNTNVTAAVGIHHPSGDVKKICFENNAPYHTSQFGAQVWYINQWEEGVTEGGSSGSPLFNQNHHIIGQLYGGFAACNGTVNNGDADWYGRFGVSWDGSSASTRLRDWLDPLNTGQVILDGWPIGSTAYSNDASMGGISGIPNVVCGSSGTPVVTILNQGTEPLTSGTISYSLNGGTAQTQNWSGNLDQYESTQVTLPLLFFINGLNTLNVSFLNPNGVTDENSANNATSVSFSAITGLTYEIGLDLVLDDYGSEVTWDVTNEVGTVLYSGGPYEDGSNGTLISETWCLSEGCYTFTIYDDFDDGICCNWGEGSYTLINQIGDSFATGGQYNTSESVQFCPQDLSVEDLSFSRLTLYPNPTEDQLWLSWEGDVRAFFIYDARGAMLAEVPVNGKSTQLNTSALPAGYYFVQAMDASGRRIQRTFVKQ